MTKQEFTQQCKIEAMKIILTDFLKERHEFPSTKDMEKITLRASVLGSEMTKHYNND